MLCAKYSCTGNARKMDLTGTWDMFREQVGENGWSWSNV